MTTFLIHFYEKTCLLLISLYMCVSHLRNACIRRAILVRRREIARLDKAGHAMTQKRLIIEQEIASLNAQFTKV